MAVLIRVGGGPAGQLLELKGPETLIGRLPECGIILEKSGVSRKHAAIRQNGNTFTVTDLESRNFTFLNHRQLPPLQPHELKPGDRITICDVEFAFHLTPPAPQPPAESEVINWTNDQNDSTVHVQDASSLSDLQTVKPEVKLKAILEITRNLSSSLELEQVAPKTLETLLSIFPQAERGFLVLLKSPTEKTAIRQVFHKLRPLQKPSGKHSLARPQDDDTRMSISRTIMKYALDQRKAVLSQDAGQDANLPTSASIADLRIRSFMCAPLLTPDEQVLGIMQIDTTSRERFIQEDLELLVAVAGQAAIVIQNADRHESILANERINRDLKLAEQVQLRFLPQEVPEVPGFEFFEFYQAAHKIGGDYYDFVPLPEDRLAVAVGDVCGKGISAALMMAKFSGDTRFWTMRENSPDAAAARLNTSLCTAGLEERFITLCLGVLDTRQSVFKYISAGHLPVYVRRAGGDVQIFGADISGFPLGVLPASTYKQETINLQPGDVVILYSDGVTDGQNPKGEPYDSEANPRLRRRLAAVSGTPKEVGKALIQDQKEFCAGAPQVDDMTLVCFGPVTPASD